MKSWLLHLPVAEMAAVAHTWRAVEDTDASVTSSPFMSLFSPSAVHIVIVITAIQGGPKMAPFFVRLIISSSVSRYSNFFHCQNHETIRNITITIDPTTSQVCRYTSLWNIRRRTQPDDATCECRLIVDPWFRYQPVALHLSHCIYICRTHFKHKVG